MLLPERGGSYVSVCLSDYDVLQVAFHLITFYAHGGLYIFQLLRTMWIIVRFPDAAICITVLEMLCRIRSTD